MQEQFHCKVLVQHLTDINIFIELIRLHLTVNAKMFPARSRPAALLKSAAVA